MDQTNTMDDLNAMNLKRLSWLYIISNFYSDFLQYLTLRRQ